MRGQVASRGLVDDEARIGVFLQKAGRDRVGDLAFDGALDDRRLMLPECHDHDLPGLEYRADAHGNGLLRYVLFAEKTAGGISPRDRIERRQTSPAGFRGSRLVKADVAGPANTQNLQIDPARRAYCLLVAGAVVANLIVADSPVGNVNVVAADVYVIEESFSHPAVVALGIIRLHWVIFVQVESDDPGKIELRLLVKPNELAIKT